MVVAVVLPITLSAEGVSFSKETSRHTIPGKFRCRLDDNSCNNEADGTRKRAASFHEHVIASQLHHAREKKVHVCCLRTETGLPSAWETKPILLPARFHGESQAIWQPIHESEANEIRSPNVLAAGSPVTFGKERKKK